eukprot:4650252-Pyramimonas_sp.AAC.1
MAPSRLASTIGSPTPSQSLSYPSGVLVGSPISISSGHHSFSRHHEDGGHFCCEERQDNCRVST